MGYLNMPYFDDEITPAIKKQYAHLVGYCRKCNHRDCEEVRKIRGTPCHICGKDWEAGDPYYLTKDNVAICPDCMFKDEEVR